MLALSFPYRLLVSWASGCKAILDGGGGGGFQGDLRKVGREDMAIFTHLSEQKKKHVIGRKSILLRQVPRKREFLCMAKNSACTNCTKSLSPHPPLIRTFLDHITSLTSLQEFVVLIIRVFASKTLNNGSAKTPKASNDDEKHRENSVQKETDTKQTKRQRLLQRGGESSPSQQRILMCIPRSEVTDENGRRRHFGDEAADYKVAGSDTDCREQGVKDINADQEVKRKNLNCTDKRLTNERYVDCSRLSENAVQRNSFDESLVTRSESDFDINTESTDQNLLEEEAFRISDKRESEEEKCGTDTKNNCETCQGLLNEDKHNRVICTAL